MNKRLVSRNREPRTKNTRFLSKQELKSFLAMTEERIMAIGPEIYDWLLFDDIKQIEAVIFNGLVDAYILGRKNKLRLLQFVWIDPRLLKGGENVIR